MELVLRFPRILPPLLAVLLAGLGLSGCAVYDGYAYDPYADPYGYYGTYGYYAAPNYAYAPPAYGSFGFYFGDGGHWGHHGWGHHGWGHHGGGHWH